MAVRSTPPHSGRVCSHSTCAVTSAATSFAARCLVTLSFLLPVTTSACRHAIVPDPPGGGTHFTLDYARFVDEVEPILARRGCAAVGDCHGGGVRGTFALSPLDARDPAYDFAQASLQVDGYHPVESPLLTKPLALAAGGSPHAAKPFTDRDDLDFVALEAWVETATAAEVAR